MFAQPPKHSTVVPAFTKNENPKDVTTIAVHVSTTVHTVVEPWSPDVPIETQSGESASLTPLTDRT